MCNLKIIQLIAVQRNKYSIYLKTIKICVNIVAVLNICRKSHRKFLKKTSSYHTKKFLMDSSKRKDTILY